jgi:propanol-preferring alcohol dehydrogenase
MRACALHTPAPVESRPLALADPTVPEPSANEVLIRVRACGVCRTDLHVVEGELPARKLPVIPGHQVVGAIERVSAPPSGVRGRPSDRGSKARLIPASLPGIARQVSKMVDNAF